MIFDPEDGDDTFLRNAGLHTDYMGLYNKKMTMLLTTRNSEIVELAVYLQKKIRGP
jgi:hypothetical protein